MISLREKTNGIFEDVSKFPLHFESGVKLFAILIARNDSLVLLPSKYHDCYVFIFPNPLRTAASEPSDWFRLKEQWRYNLIKKGQFLSPL